MSKDFDSIYSPYFWGISNIIILGIDAGGRVIRAKQIKPFLPAVPQLYLSGDRAQQVDLRRVYGEGRKGASF